MKEKQGRFGLSGIRRQQLNKSDSGDGSSTSTSTTTMMMMMMKRNKMCDSNACVRYIERTEASVTVRQAVRRSVNWKKCSSAIESNDNFRNARLIHSFVYSLLNSSQIDFSLVDRIARRTCLLLCNTWTKIQNSSRIRCVVSRSIALHLSFNLFFVCSCTNLYNAIGK